MVEATRRKGAQLGWVASYKVAALILYTLTVGFASRVITISDSGRNDDILLLWAVPTVIGFPSSLIALSFAIIPLKLGPDGSPYLVEIIFPTLSFGVFGGLQWFLIGGWVDKRRARSPASVSDSPVAWGTRKTALLCILAGLSLVLLPIVFWYFLRLQTGHALGDSAGLALFMPSLCCWILAPFFVFNGVFSLATFSSKKNRGCCEECGYNLRGLVENRCPECGNPFDPGLLRTQTSDKNSAENDDHSEGG